jgi:hypothetical protein
MQYVRPIIFGVPQSSQRSKGLSGLSDIGGLPSSRRERDAISRRYTDTM